MVFYRKYRPQRIDDLDSESVRNTLYAVLQKEVPHAFLFTGPKGLGKTSTARIVAKVVNCTTVKTKREKNLEPCDTCDQCVSITSGTNMDVLEIDAASNRGIDEIRDLKEKIRLAPVSAKRKVYIIDEVHMLTTEAFNALLKTLEEPPDHAMFILCTTEAHKVPDTIVSRCFQIMFKPATDAELVRSFKRIVKGEKIKFEKGKEDEVLHYIAKISDKGFRDGVKILEEINLVSQGRDVSIELIESTYKTTKAAIYVWEFFNAIAKRRDSSTDAVKDGLTVIKSLVDDGVDMKYFLNYVIEELHSFLLRLMQVSDEKRENEYTFTLRETTKLTELFTKAYADMKYAVLPQLPLELAVIEWCEEAGNQAGQNAALNAANAEPRGTEPKKRFIAEDTEVSVSSLRKQVGTMKKLKAMYGSSTKPNSTEEESVSISTTTVELMHTSGDGTVTQEWLEAFWKSLISEMKKYNHTVAGVLRGCTISSYADQKLVIQTAYKFHKERLDDMKNRDALLKISKLLTGKDVQIEVELRNKAPRI